MTEATSVADENRRWAARLVQACTAAGCDHFFLAPDRAVRP